MLKKPNSPPQFSCMVGGNLKSGCVFVMSGLGKRCGYELGRSGLAYRALKLGRLGFGGANDVLEQRRRASFARHC